MISLNIDGIPVLFLVDSGATTSVLQRDYYNGTLTRSPPSIGISGILTKTYQTQPVKITNMLDQDLGTHSFRIIPDCPVNLLGRDLITKLEVTISPNDNGLLISSPHFFLADTGSPESPETDPLLETVNPSIWAQGPYDTGLISCTPYKATLKEGTTPVYIKQYPLSPEKISGLEPMVNHFLDKGILKKIFSPYCTPINPVCKADGSTRFVQDLRAINQLVVPIAPIVPEIPTLLSSIPAQATHFSVIDLKNAFFSIPVDPATQRLFAFSFKGQQLTWCRLPQGFIDSPVVYTIVLQATLQSWHPPQGSVLLQYADDLLLCSSSREACREDGVSLLNWLAACGHKVSKNKMQWCKTQVDYLGFVLKHGERHVSPKRIQSVLGLARPTTQKEMLSFLGMINYCRQWIADCSYYDNILRQCTLSDKPSWITWTKDMLQAYETLRMLLVCTPALGLPDYVNFFSIICERQL